MNRILLSLLVLFSASVICAAVTRYRPDHWVKGSQVILRGEVAKVERVADRPLTWHSEKDWIFPHEAARIIVSEVLKNKSGIAVATGDTVTLIYTFDNHGTNPQEPELDIWVEDIKLKRLEVGLIGLFSLRDVEGEWYSGSFFHHLDIDKLPEVRAEVEKQQAESGASEK